MMDVSLISPPLKIVLLLATGISVHFSLTPPHGRAPPKTVVSNKTLFERAVQWVTWCSKVRCRLLLPKKPVAALLTL
jgi:hypothetical protein